MSDSMKIPADLKIVEAEKDPALSGVDLLKIQELVSAELRHTATIVWQFSIAILTLQSGAIVIACQVGMEKPFAKVVLGVSFFLAMLFSMMLVRQCHERKHFVERIREAEAALRISKFRLFFPKISEGPFYGFKSHHLGWVLFLESFAGFVFFCTRLAS